MQNKRTLGIAFAVLGLLMTCCLCPMVINSLVFISSAGRTSLYGRAFPKLIGRLTTATYISGAQLVCASSLALIVLVIGIVVFVQSRGNDLKPMQ